MREAIKRPVLRAEIEETLARIVAEGHAIQSLVVHRDGRWAESESQGLREALHTLQSRGTLRQNLRYAALEVRKNHMPVRLFTLADAPGPARLLNPLPGTHLAIDQQRLLLTTTGRPGTLVAAEPPRLFSSNLSKPLEIFGFRRSPKMPTD
jgi:hypothetical protein